MPLSIHAGIDFRGAILANSGEARQNHVDESGALKAPDARMPSKSIECERVRCNPTRCHLGVAHRLVGDVKGSPVANGADDRPQDLRIETPTNPRNGVVCRYEPNPRIALSNRSVGEQE